MDFIIRNAVSADCAKIRPLQEEIALLHHEGRPDLFRTEARYFTQEDFDKRLADPAHCVFIAESESGEVIGYAFSWIISARNNPTYIDFDCCYIDDVCVLSSWQGRGVGKEGFAVLNVEDPVAVAAKVIRFLAHGDGAHILDTVKITGVVQVNSLDMGGEDLPLHVHGQLKRAEGVRCDLLGERRGNVEARTLCFALSLGVGQKVGVVPHCALRHGDGDGV